MLPRDKKIIIFGILLLVLLLKISIRSYGLPNLFHPDEPYIFKDPFKLLYNYSKFDFSNTTNLYFWILTIWYLIYFLLGLSTGKIADINDFHRLLASEDPGIILHGRLLNILLSIIGAYFILKIIFKRVHEPFLQYIFGLTFVLNPIEIISDLWIKFDGAAYCILCILLYLSYNYFSENNKNLRSKIYLLSIVALSVRVDLISFLVAFCFIDFLVYRNEIGTKAFFAFLIKPFVYGILLYSLITLLPFVIILGNKFASGNGIPVTKTFEKAISNKYNFMNIGALLKIVLSNGKFYLVTCTLIAFGPLIVFPLLRFFKKILHEKFLLLMFGMLCILLAPLVLFGYRAPHYFLLSSLSVLILSFICITNFKDKKFKYFISAFNLLYIGSITFQIIYSVNYIDDTRVSAKKYLIGSTSKTDIIAIEEYLNAGFFPPISECPEVLLSKIEAIKELNIGTGETFLQQIAHINTNECRSVLEVSAPKRFANTPYENLWAIDYDPALMRSKKPSYFVSMKDYFTDFRSDSFTRMLIADYFIQKTFKMKFIDPRIKTVIANENFFPDFFIYKRKK